MDSPWISVWYELGIIDITGIEYSLNIDFIFPWGKLKTIGSGASEAQKAARQI